MGRTGLSAALVAMLAASSMAQVTTTTDAGTTTADTTVIATTIETAITTVIDSTTTAIDITTVLTTTVTVEPTSEATTDTTTESATDSTTESTTETVTTTVDSSTTSESSTSSTSATTSNAPQYTGANFHIESSQGNVVDGAAQDGLTRKNLIFDDNVQSEYTLDGFGHLVSRSDGYIAQTNAGAETVYVDVAPASSRAKRQVTGTPLTCSVATNGILSCTGASGSVFYTDGTTLYLGDNVPAGFTPITLIAVIDAAVTSGTSASTVAPTGPVPTTGPTTPVYAGWGQWSYPQPTGVPVALTTTIVLPGPGGYQTQTVTVTSMHCGCTETPLPTEIVMTTYVTSCPTEWGYTTPVTVAVPVKPTGAVWGSGNSGSYDNSGWVTYGSTSGSGSGSSSGSSNGTGNSYNGKPYTGAASPVGVSAGLLSVSIAMLALML